MKKSWRTTTAGIAGIVASIALAVKAFLDGDPETTVNVGELITAIMGTLGSIGLINARDNKVSSEDAGAK